MKADLRHGDAFGVLPNIAADSAHSFVTDGPYGIAFMGKTWDGDGIAFPGEAAGGPRAFQAWTERWAREALRILKPGGHLLSFGSTRTSHRMVAGIEDAGFEIRGTVHWTFGSGFPKSHNLDGEHEGWGTALKPSHEHVCVARKPLEGTVAENMARHGVGALNVEACRVAGNDNPSQQRRAGAAAMAGGIWPDRRSAATYAKERHGEAVGRWPPDTILTHAAACRWLGTKVVHGNGHTPAQRGQSPLFGPSSGGGGLGGQAGLEERDFVDEVVADYDCAQDCPVRLLDEQSGLLKSGGTPPNRPSKGLVAYGRFGGVENPDGIGGSEGTASRFFPTLNWSQHDMDWLPFFYEAKASRAEREGGLGHLEPRRFEQSGGAQGAIAEGADYGEAQGIGLNRVKEVRNHHPTVKPIALMEWLVQLVTPASGLVVDPFMGSGTTGCAAVRIGRRFLGIEREADYMRIARARVAYHSQPLLDGVPRPERSLADFLQSDKTWETTT